MGKSVDIFNRIKLNTSGGKTQKIKGHDFRHTKGNNIKMHRLLLVYVSFHINHIGIETLPLIYIFKLIVTGLFKP